MQKTEAQRIRFNRQMREWKRKHKQQVRSNVYAQRNIPLKDACERCGATEDLMRHHPDYNKPLEVLTLCRSCHSKAHSIRKKIKINLKGRHCDSCGKVFGECERKHPSYVGRSCTFWIPKEKAKVLNTNRTY